MKLSLRFCLPLLALAPLAALAQPKKPAAPAPQKPAPPPVSAAKDTGGQVDISNALDGTSTYDDAQGLARITKDVVITQRGENLVVYAQQALYSRAQNQATATGQLRVVTRDSTIRGLNLRADFDERRFTISGSVTITSHGKQDGNAPELRGEVSKKPIRVLCDQVVWEYDTRQATATGNIRIFQGTNQGTCNKIVYDEAQNIVNLIGNVQFGDDQNRTFIGQDIRFYIDSNTVASDSRVRIKFKDKEGLNGNSSPAKTPRPQKTPIPFKPVPSLPPDLLGNLNAPLPPVSTPAPAATEEPIPTPAPDDPADAAPKN
ncbi:LPS-assembly protein LptD [Abditibacteriota bacterium]|nr:LPS-assembly protein LptD [Abditibacteriota bacterium]